MKKKQVEMPKLKPQKSKIVWKWWIAVGLTVGLLFGLALWARSQSKKEVAEYIEKGAVTNYVCKIVGAEPDQDIVAVQCFAK